LGVRLEDCPFGFMRTGIGAEARLYPSGQHQPGKQDEQRGDRQQGIRLLFRRDIGAMSVFPGLVGPVAKTGDQDVCSVGDAFQDG